MAEKADTRKAVYAGSFDLLTLGHLWVIEQGSKLFDALIVAVGNNPSKKEPMFDIDERIQMLKDATAHLDNVEIMEFRGKYQFQFAQEVGAEYLFRGIRNQADYEYEREMNHFNAEHAPGLLSVPVLAPRELAEIKSSFVKELIGFEGWQEIVARYVPAPILERVLEKGLEVIHG